MDAAFWHKRWEDSRIGFHNSEVHPMLSAHFQVLSVPKDGRVFVPLCGKSLDIHWLLGNGQAVVGVELSPIAIEQLFQELGVEPIVTPVGQCRRYSAQGIDVFVGDLFDLGPEEIGPVHAVYDRAALVALPAPMRVRYVPHVTSLARGAPQLLITFDYDQSKVDGPPFSISAQDCMDYYHASYAAELLESQPLAGGLKGVCDALECAWLLKPRTGSDRSAIG